MIKSGTHWLGLFKSPNQSMPIITNIEPKPATIIIGNTLSDGFIVYTYKGADSGVFFWDDNYAYEFSGDEYNAYFIAKDFNELMKIANLKIE